MSRRDPRKFLEDLYKDLDDRHLLLPAIALVIAIAAVPLLLSSGGPEPVPPPPAVTDSEPSAVEPAVLAGDAGVRNYRERLEMLKEKNPFKQQFIDSPSAEGSGAADTGAGASIETAATGGGLAVPAAAPPAGSPNGIVPTDTGGAVPGSSAPETVTETRTVTETKEVARLVTRRVDVAVGPQGDVRERKGLKAITVLPSKRMPVVAFLGVSEDAKRATFAVSADVESTGGAGTCVGGGPIGCEFLTLKVGQQQSFEYAPDGQTYRLKLLGVEDVEVKPKGKSAG